VGDALIASLDLVVFLSVATDIRLARLKAREAAHFGADAVAPGGYRHPDCESFIEWASHYEDGTREGRNRARQESWLARLPCPVLRLDGTMTIDALVDAVIQKCSELTR
jgi:hypothetical protein